MKRKFVAWMIAIQLLLVPVSHAQDVTPTPEPPPDETIAVDVDFVKTGTPFDEVLNSFLVGISGLVYLPGAVGIVTVLTSFTKRFVSMISANLIALFWMLVFWILYLVTRNLGIDNVLYERTLNGITEVGYVLLFASGTQIVSGWWYQKNREAKVPIVGYSKSDDGG